VLARVPAQWGDTQRNSWNDGFAQLGARFRRRYYENGSHAGFILYLTDDKAGQGDIDALRDALKSAKGPGNFRNLFYDAPGGSKDGMQLIPVSEVAGER
jgi:capsid portal protein